ncbi:glycosyltransferase [Flavobacteriales bacterium]|nr:glycosyltransferase [Flavobacteriales bacterium]
MLSDYLGIDVGFLLLLVFIVAFSVQLFFFLFFFIRLVFYKQLDTTNHNLPVSVIIAARNEEKNLIANLPKIFDQDYPEFEVIVVNDRSWDDTADILDAFKRRYDNLHVVNISESANYSHSKKFALTLGIKGAKYENLLFTDADCHPVSNKWITKMSRSFMRKSLILGYSPYQKKKGLLNKLIRFDTVQIGIQYLSFALAGIPYMGVGRNMSYNKELFFSVGGFKSHYHVASGDDDLFVNEVADHVKVSIVFEPDSQMMSLPELNYTDWCNQKRRHFTTAKHYRSKHKFLLSLFPASFLLLVASFIPLLLTQYWMMAIIGIAIRLLVQLLILNKPMRALGGSDLVIFAPLIELIFLIINPVIYFSNFIIKPTKWH